MARKSSIDKLEPQVRDLIKKLRVKDGRTIDEILAKLQELEVDVSRTALGRHTKDLDQLVEFTKYSREAANVLVDRLGYNTDNRVARANIEILHAAIMRLMMAGTEEGGKISFDSEEVMFLARALKDLASAQKADQDRELKLREQIRKEEREKAIAEAAETVDKALADAKGVTTETRDKIRRELGVG
ncbi:DUF3486 family protein [Marivibrio halodurans]|uniref:DUF3486 family protein n=1 Tax=Marivibrio halodurans TaxID=2039722 RepID=A0A8J7V0Z4_9PROT|nr:phage protein Gp27 family protein [Marivibrio halodurans]MBP5857281.1 DUF3486 family protein [Marivibrio halodurans]